MNNFLVLTKEKIAAIVLALAPRFVGRDQDHLLALSDITADAAYERSLIDIVPLQEFDADLQGAGGSELVGYSVNALGASVRNVQERLSMVLYPEDFGAVGDGVTNDNAALNSLATAASTIGAHVELDGTKDYGVGLQWVIPAGVKIRTNGARIIDINGTASASPLLSIGGEVEFDNLRVHIPTGKTRRRLATVTGDNCVFNTIHFTSDDQQANTADNSDAGLRVVGVNGTRIGHMICDKIDRPIQVNNTIGTTIGGVTFTNYVTGLWGIDNRKFYAGPSHMHTKSPNASYLAGHVGVLLSSDVEGNSDDVRLVDFLIEDSGEHGIRVGGPKPHGSMDLVRVRTRNTGGSGIKVLGTDSLSPTDINKWIRIIDPDVIDAGSGSLTSNMCGILVMFANNVKVINPTVRKDAKLVSAHTGIRVVASTDVEIIYPDVQYAQDNGIWLDGSLGALTRVNVTGGWSKFNGGDAYELQSTVVACTDCNVDGLNCYDNGGLGFNINVSGGGALGRPVMRFITAANDLGAGACDAVAFTLNITGGPGSTPITGVFARNGSTWNDHANLYLRKAGVWTAL